MEVHDRTRVERSPGAVDLPSARRPRSAGGLGWSPIPELIPAEDWSRLVDTLRLTRREADILRCAFYDERSTSLGKSLQLSRNTVHAYRERLFRKLDVESMTQAIARVFAVYVMLHCDVADVAVLPLGQSDTPKRA